MLDSMEMGPEGDDHLEADRETTSWLYAPNSGVVFRRPVAGRERGGSSYRAAPDRAWAERLEQDNSAELWSAAKDFSEHFPARAPSEADVRGILEELSVRLIQDRAAVSFLASYRSHRGCLKSCELTVASGRLIRDHGQNFTKPGEGGPYVVDYSFEIYEVLEGTVDWDSDQDESFAGDYTAER